MTASLLEVSGRSVGLTTSPHLERVNERIVWDGDPIPDAELARVLTQIAARRGVPRRTAELLRDHDRRGLHVLRRRRGASGGDRGRHGRNVGRDEHRRRRRRRRHQRGHRPCGVPRADPTRHRDGTRRASSALARRSCSGETDADLVADFSARDPGRIWLRDRDFGVGEQRLAHGGHLVSLWTPDAVYEDVFVPLHGPHQVDNAAVALAAAQAAVGVPLDPETVNLAFDRVLAPGRLEVMDTQPLVVIDGAHNVGRRRGTDPGAPRGVRSRAPHVRPRSPPREGSDRDARGARRSRTCERLVCTRPPSPRGMDPSAVADAAIALGLDADRIDITPRVDRAVARAREDHRRRGSDRRHGVALRRGCGADRARARGERRLPVGPGPGPTLSARDRAPHPSRTLRGHAHRAPGRRSLALRHAGLCGHRP